jgi:hypothetical protein
VGKFTKAEANVEVLGVARTFVALAGASCGGTMCFVQVQAFLDRQYQSVRPGQDPVECWWSLRVR